MESQWINEQEVSYTWLVNSSPSEQENVLDWVKNISMGAAQGAGTGAAAGPWGALVGGLIGGGLGALQQATQRPGSPPAAPSAVPQPAPQPPAPSAAPQPAPQPPAPSAAPQPAPQPPAPVAPSAASPATPPTPASTNKDGAGAVQQFAQLLPQLVQLIQAIQPVVTSAQQSKARTGESVEGELAAWAGDRVPDSAFMDEQDPEPWIDEDSKNEDLEIPEPLEPAPPRLTDGLLPAKPEASALQPVGASTLAFSDEWVTEAEAAPVMGSGFQWVG